MPPTTTMPSLRLTISSFFVDGTSRSEAPLRLQPASSHQAAGTTRKPKLSELFRPMPRMSKMRLHQNLRLRPRAESARRRPLIPPWLMGALLRLISFPPPSPWKICPPRLKKKLCLLVWKAMQRTMMPPSKVVWRPTRASRPAVRTRSRRLCWI